MPLALWSGEVYRRAEYSVQGHRLIPIAIGLEILTIALGIFILVLLAAG